MTVDQTNTVRAFVRNFNLAIKLVALYGSVHKQASAQLESSWRELRSVLDAEKKLLIGASAEKLLFGGKPLQAGSSDRALAQVLGSASIGGLNFLDALTFDEYVKFITVIAKTKPPDLIAELKTQLGPKSNVRVMEFRLVGGDEPEARSGGMGVATQLASSVLAPGATTGFAAPGSPTDILRLLSSLQPTGAASGGVATAAASTSDDVAQVGESDVTNAIRWLAELSGANQQSAAPSQLPANSAAALAQAAASMSQADLAEQPAIVALAEQLAIRVALEKYKKGEIPFDAVQQMLDRLKKEIENLNKVIGVHTEAMQQAGVDVETPSDILERQFWAAIPDRNKLQVLLSEDAWCIPARNIHAYMQELLAANDSANAERILRHYCSLVRTADADALAKVVKNIGVLADVYAAVSPKLLHWVVALFSKQLTAEFPAELRASAATTLGKLVAQAANARNYAALADALDDVRDLEATSRGFAHQLRAELNIDSSVAEFISSAVELSSIPAELAHILRLTPELSARELGARFGHSVRREHCQRLVAVASELGRPILDSLHQTLARNAALQAIPAIGLLAAVDAMTLEAPLRKRLPQWSLVDQAAIVHQVACSGSPKRGVLLARLLPDLNPLIVAQTIDEIGLSGSAESKALHELAMGKGVASGNAFLQAKAVEALGNLADSSATQLLNSMLMAKRWSWTNPRELRVVALQSLIKISAANKQLIAASGLSEDELRFSPLPPADGQWARSRRYERVAMEGAWAVLHHPGGSCNVSVETLSLGGGIGVTSSRVQLAPDGVMELKIGLRKFSAHVLLYSKASYKIAFEIAAMDLEDRTRLRQFLMSKMAE